MFEQSMLMSPPAGKRWTVFASLSGELLIVGLLAIIPLIYTSQLPPFAWRAFSLIPPGPAPSQPPASHHRSAARIPAIQTPRMFVFPAPRRLADLSRLPLESAVLEAPSANGVAGGIGEPSSAGGIVAQFAQPVVVAAPPPAIVSRPAAASAVRVNGGVQAAKLIRKVIPEYPALARAARISGVVNLVGVIGRDGRIEKLEVISGHPLLIRAALDAVRQWIYRPTLLSGEPVEVIAPIEVRFKIGE